MSDDRSALARRSRNKGAAFEREVAKRLFDLTGMTFKRILKQTQEAGHGDLATDDAAWPFLIECKHHKENSFRTEWLEDAVEAARAADQVPAVVYRVGEGSRCRSGVKVPYEAIGAAFGGAPGDCDLWADIDLDGLAFLAREIMAREEV